MAIPESQLETWTHQGAITTAKATADSIKNALNTYDGWPDSIKYDVYLQGSYKNSTNIRGDMDVDVIAQLTTTFRSNLSEEDELRLGITEATYKWEDFRRNIINALQEYYGFTRVQEGKKSLKVNSDGNRLPTDVVVCIQYRKYLDLSKFIEGMTFWIPNESRWVVNYPKLHYENGVDKHQNANNRYKPNVRMFKNVRNYLIGQGIIQDDFAPSYFLECLIHNVPNENFGGSYQGTFCNIVNWLNDANLDGFICQNGQLKLFGMTSEQWNTNQAKEFIKNLISLWDNW